MRCYVKSLLCGAAIVAGVAVLNAQAAGTPAAATVKVRRMIPAQPSQVAPDRVSVLVFFDFKPASKALFHALDAWAQGAGSEIVLDREPLVDSDKSPLAHAFVVARTLGVTETVLPALFKLAASPPEPQNKNQDDEVALKSAIADIFDSAGINEIEFQTAWNSGASKSGLLHARLMSGRFEAKGAPLLIVNGLWKLEPGSGASADETIAALDRQVNKIKVRITAER
jgi:hypothetical protein